MISSLSVWYKKIILVILSSLCFICLANSTQSYNTYPASENRPWAFLLFYGRMTNNEIGEVLTFSSSLADESLYSVEVSKELDDTNAIRRFLQPIITSMSAALNLTYRDDLVGPIYEINPYLLFQWSNFPWQKYLVTTIGVGEGLSYDTKVPQAESQNSTNTQNLLNFLMFEIAFALPSHPNFEVIGRIHHRSGVYGLYTDGNSGSTAVGIAVRYHF